METHIAIAAYTLLLLLLADNDGNRRRRRRRHGGASPAQDAAPNGELRGAAGGVGGVEPAVEVLLHARRAEPVGGDAGAVGGFRCWSPARSPAAGRRRRRGRSRGCRGGSSPSASSSAP